MAYFITSNAVSTEKDDDDDDDDEEEELVVVVEEEEEAAAEEDDIILLLSLFSQKNIIFPIPKNVRAYDYQMIRRHNGYDPLDVDLFLLRHLGRQWMIFHFHKRF